MTPAPSVSVVIPTHNRARFLGAAIESLRAQTRVPDEIIVIDDDSTDDTADVVAAMGADIRYRRVPHGGAGAARNHGLALARGSLIAFLDSDDLWRPDKLRFQVDLLEAMPDSAFCFTDFSILKDHGGMETGGLERWCGRRHPPLPETVSAAGLGIRGFNGAEDVPLRTGPLYEPLLADPWILPSSTVVRRSLLAEDVRFPEGCALYEDWEFFARLSLRGPALFAACETTINRGHDDAERLTRAGPARHASERLALIERVWEADPEFATHHADRIERIKARQRLILAKQQILGGDLESARVSLRGARAARSAQDRAERLLTWTVLHAPPLAHIARRLRNRPAGGPRH